MAISDADLTYWLGVVFAARKKGDTNQLAQALKALRERGVAIAFNDECKQSGNHTATNGERLNHREFQ